MRAGAFVVQDGIIAWWSGLRMLLIGGTAGLLGFLVGNAVRWLLG